MPELPAIGTRVSVRYRRPPGSVPPLTDVVGHLEHGAPKLRVRTKAGDAVEFSAEDVVFLRELSDAPVRNSQIRRLEEAAALAWPGVEQEWLDGWLLRFGRGSTHRANSAVPLGVSASTAAVPAIRRWYSDRGRTPWLAVPDRLLHLSAAGINATNVMSRVLGDDGAPEGVTLSNFPDDGWLSTFGRDVPVDVLTAVLDGEVVFASRRDHAVGRGAVTSAPDGTRWLGISSVRVAPDARREGHARSVCAALLAWGHAQGATSAYVQVQTDNDAAITLYRSMGFGLHHTGRYIDATRL